jgi:hypothetical protein
VDGPQFPESVRLSSFSLLEENGQMKMTDVSFLITVQVYKQANVQLLDSQGVSYDPQMVSV